MKKIFYFSVLISAAFLAQIAPADAQLPSSPLNEEYALTGAESVGNTWGGTYEIGAAGVLNISGGGMLTVTYGQNQWGTKKSPEAETYIALSKNYAAVIKQLTELVPAAKRKTSRLAALREE